MRMLAFDHFFGQDLDALAVALAPGDVMVRLPYQRLHRVARRAFPTAALSGIAPAYESSERAWAKYSKIARRRADWWLDAYGPDVFVTPSDLFFYLRPMIERFRERGLATVVVQKETTVSPLVMDAHSGEVGRVVPFMSDVMTVCSDRQREFWMRAGTDPDRIIVTGQPRFDVYASHHARRRTDGSRPRLLYLSYDDRAYLPSDIGREHEGTWCRLRQETEQALSLVSGRWQVVVKHHPQQPVAPEWLGSDVERAPRDADTRLLILAADAVVGFQTTALFEAAVAGRPIVYPAWGDEYERSRLLLTPFEEFDIVTHARSPAELVKSLEGDPVDLPRASDRGRAVAMEHLGVVDGQASERVVQVIRAHATAGTTVHLAEPTPTERARAVALGTGAPALRWAARLPGLSGTARSRLARRASDWEQEWRELNAIIRDAPAR